MIRILDKKLSLGGSISFSPDVNKGSAFGISMPLNMPGIGYGSSRDKGILPKGAKTILIVEDEPLNFMFLKELLQCDQTNILHASDGSKAVLMCKENENIDLILMDIKMPVMDGRTAARLIKEFRPGLPIIAQTAYVQESEKNNYKDVFDDYLVKPIRMNLLQEKLLRFT